MGHLDDAASHDDTAAHGAATQLEGPDGLTDEIEAEAEEAAEVWNEATQDPPRHGRPIAASGAHSEPPTDVGPKGVDGTDPGDERRWLGQPGRRIPSLSAPDAAFAAVRDALHARPTAASQIAREQLRRASRSATCWGWDGSDTEKHTCGALAVVRLYRRAWAVETTWAPDGERARRRNGWHRILWRGVRPQEAAAVGRGDGLQATAHDGSIAHHARDVESGSSHKTDGLSMSKDGFIAARYAAQSNGVVLCLRADDLRRTASRAQRCLLYTSPSPRDS